MEEIEIIDNPIDHFYSSKFSELIRLLLVGDRKFLGFELKEERKKLWTLLDDNKENHFFKHILIPIRKNTALYKIPGHVAFEIASKCYDLINKDSYITETRIENFIEESFKQHHMDTNQYYITKAI